VDRATDGRWLWKTKAEMRRMTAMRFDIQRTKRPCNDHD
jgi:hypothetical protein